MGVLGPVLTQFDLDNDVPAPGGHNKNKDSPKERALVVNVLTKSDIYKTMDTRKHNRFPHSKNILHGKPQANLIYWMKQKLHKTLKKVVAT